MRNIAAILLLLHAAVPAHAASLCEDLARPLRQGKINGLEPDRSLIDRLAKTNPRLVEGNEERFETSVPKPFHMPKGAETVSYQPFGRSGVVAIMSVAGSMHCESFAFQQRKSNRSVRFPPPPGFSSGDDNLCWDSYAQVGSVRGIPVLFKMDDGDHAQSLTIYPLRGRKWAPACRIDVEYAPTLRIDEAYCKSGACPADLSRKAVHIAQTYNAKSGQPDRIAGPQAAPLLDLSAKAKDQLSRIPDFGINSSNPYRQFSESQTFALLLDGKPTLAVVGGGLFGWREYRGVLVAFWQVTGDRLAPLAGFQIQKANQTVKNVSVTAP